MNTSIGKKVLMTKSNAKWYLDNPDVYYSFDEEYETETLLHLMCLFGVPVIGTIIGKGNDCWRVEFNVGNLTTSYYAENKKHFTYLK